MSADRTSVITMRGKVIKKAFGKGSKSDHEAVYLQTEEDAYVLRRVGANPFEDKKLLAFVGKEVEVKGKVSGYVFMADDVREL